MYEKIPENETADIQAVVDFSLALMDPTRRPTLRGQHAKHHGCVRGELYVEPSLPAELARGVFAVPRPLPVWIRFSNGSQVDDRRGDVHGMAIKVMNVDGEKLLEGERNERTQDFIFMDHPAFFARDTRSSRSLAHAMVRSRLPSVLKKCLFWCGEEKRRALYVILSHFVFGLRFHELSVLRSAIGKIAENPLDLSYWSATPYKLGDLAVKYKAIPSTPAQTCSTGQLNEKERASPDSLRLAMRNRLLTNEATFDLLVQPFQDETRTPIEDASIVWQETVSPFRKVARLVIPSQTFDSDAQMSFCENLSFNPWHSLPEHRPLGGINRLRKHVYLASSKLRHEANGVPQREPQPAPIDPSVGSIGAQTQPSSD